MAERIVAPFTLRKLKMGYSTAWFSCIAPGVYPKKDRARRRVNCPDASSRPSHWKHHQGRIDPHKTVFIDKTWIRVDVMKPMVVPHALAVTEKQFTAG